MARVLADIPTEAGKLENACSLNMSYRFKEGYKVDYIGSITGIIAGDTKSFFTNVDLHAKGPKRPPPICRKPRMSLPYLNTQEYGRIPAFMLLFYGFSGHSCTSFGLRLLVRPQIVDSQNKGTPI